MDLDGRRAVEAHMKEERARNVNLDGERAGGVDLDGGCAVEGTHGGGARHRHGGGRCGVKADVEKEQVSMGVWQGNDRVKV
jgi:hypothetical protein